MFVPPKEQPSHDTIRANLKELFTVQERSAIADLIQRGHIDHVAAALDPDSPERAYWLDQYLIMKRPKEEPEESAVREEMRKYEADGNAIDTPEKAAFWQKRLDLERENKPLPDLEKELKEFSKVSEESDISDEAQVSEAEPSEASEQVDVKAKRKYTKKADKQSEQA